MLPRLPNPPLHESLADIPEGDLVAQLMEHPHYRGSLLNISGFPDQPHILQMVPLREIDGRFAGDADLIVCDRAHPSVAVAVEIKRIKVGASAFRSGRPNKLKEYTKAVAQANRLARLGFSQTYLFAFVVVDSRSHNNGEYTYDGLTPELRQIVDAAITLEGLLPQVGLIVQEFVQSMDRPPLELTSGGGNGRRLASAVTQSARVTAAVARLTGWKTA